MLWSSAVFIAGWQASSGQLVNLLVNKKPTHLSGLRQSIFNGKMREWSPRVCDQFVHNFLIGDGELTGQCYRS